MAETGVQAMDLPEGSNDQREENRRSALFGFAGGLEGGGSEDSPMLKLFIVYRCAEGRLCPEVGRGCGRRVLGKLCDVS